MPQKHDMPDYSFIGIQMMGQMFEQQLRCALAFNEVMLAANPFLISAAAAPLQAPKDASRKTRAPSALPSMPQPTTGKHSMPV